MTRGLVLTNDYKLYMCSVLTPIFMALNCVEMLNYLVSLNFLRNFTEVAYFMPEPCALKKNHEKLANSKSYKLLIM